MNASVTRGRRLGGLIVVAIVVAFLLIATVQTTQWLTPSKVARTSPSEIMELALQAQHYPLDSVRPPGFIDQAFPVNGGQLPLFQSRRFELSDRADIDVYGWTFFNGPPDPRLASVTYATVDGHFAGAGAPYTRTDVGAAYHDARLDGSGYIIRIRVKTLAKGIHLLRVFACDAESRVRRIIADPVTLVVP